jgi:hypothetical protein
MPNQSLEPQTRTSPADPPQSPRTVPAHARHTRESLRVQQRAIPVLSQKRKPTFLSEYYCARAFSFYNYFAYLEDARAFVRSNSSKPWEITRVINNGTPERIEYVEAVKDEDGSVTDLMKELGL